MSPENLRLAREPLRPLSTPDSSSNNRQARPRHPQFGSQSTQRLDISAQNSSRHQSNAYGPSGGGSSLSLSLDTPTSPMAHYLASVEAVAGVSSSFIAPKSITPFESAQSSSWNLNMSYPISVPSPDPVELSEGTQQPYVSALNPCLVDVASSPRRQQPRRSVQDLGGSSLSILPRSGPSPESKPTKPRRTRTDRALEGISVSADVKGVPSKPLASTKYRASDTSSSGASSIDLSTHASPHSRSRTRGLLRAGSIASTIRSEAPPPRTIPALEEGFHAPQSSRNEGSTLVRGPKRRREAPPCPEIRLRDTSAAVGSPQGRQWPSTHRKWM